ncbi:MAG TPA: hypothetical protein VF241_12520 [Propionibacteriaceae bacterium]
MTQPQTAALWVPEHADIEGLRQAAVDCKGCECSAVRCWNSARRWGIRPVLATVHPSAVLRATAEERNEAFAGLVSDLRTAREAAISHER